VDKVICGQDNNNEDSILKINYEKD